MAKPKIKRTVVPIEAVKDTGIEERVQAYAQALCEGMSKSAAYGAAGYSCVTASNAVVFHRRYEKEIKKEIHRNLGAKAGLAISVLIDIMLNGSSEMARTKCSLEILDRAGYDKTTKISVQNEEPKSMEELQAELQKLLKSNPAVELS